MSSEVSKPDPLGLQRNDFVASAAKSIVGAIPFVGSLFVELAGTIIPNQRLDRIANFAKQLDERLAKIDRDFVRSQLTDENFTDLLEESLRQAARSVTDDRRRYIAAVVAHSLDAERISYVETKHFLRVLGEINDIEVIRLASYQYETVGKGQAFYEKHRDLLQPSDASFESSEEVHDQATVRNSYDAHLQQLGLLNPRYNVDRKTKQVQVGFDDDLELRGHALSDFGRLLLRELDLLEEEERKE